MGCGHSKINIYPRKSKNKAASNSENLKQVETEEEIESKYEMVVNATESDIKKTLKIKSVEGPFLPQNEISTSQQDFFKMLDEKIENGPDYNSESESEKFAEKTRVLSLLEKWEAAKKLKPQKPLYTNWEVAQYSNRTSISKPISNRRYPYMSQIPPNVGIGTHHHVPPPPPPLPPAIESHHQYNTTNYPVDDYPYDVHEPSTFQYSTVYAMYNIPPTYQHQTASSRQYINYPPEVAHHQMYSKRVPLRHNPQIYNPPRPIMMKPILRNGEYYNQQGVGVYQKYSEPKEQYSLIENQPSAMYRISNNHDRDTSIQKIVQNQINRIKDLDDGTSEFT